MSADKECTQHGDRRSQLPGSPIPLPDGHLACEVCGVAVPVDVFAEVKQPAKTKREPFTRCPNCVRLRAQAEEFADEDPVLGYRMGVQVALDRIEWTLWALSVIGQTTQASHVRVMLARLHGLGQHVSFRSRYGARPECCPHPWAHIGSPERAQLRAAYGAALRDRLALSAAPVDIACPSTACLMCGVMTIARPAIEVSMRGSVGATQSATWRPVTVNRTALGGAPSPGYVEGHLCAECTHAVDEVGGIGWRARVIAVAAFVARSSQQKAKRLREMTAGDFPPDLPGWGALKNEPSIKPWGHLSHVLEGF